MQNLENNLLLLLATLGLLLKVVLAQASVSLVTCETRDDVCKNGGSCYNIDTPGGKSARCDCAPKFYGDDCRFKITSEDQIPCGSYACVNNATCQFKNGTKQCVCQETFYGRNCERECLPTNWFWCEEDSRCIFRTQTCDGVNHCSDGSDEVEQNCGCPDNLFDCTNDGKQCVSMEKRCDGVNDCDNFFNEHSYYLYNDVSFEDLVDVRTPDEQNCECGVDQFACASGDQSFVCIEKDQFCDGIEHCRDGSDEENCDHAPCTNVDEIMCDNGDCIPNNKVCDGMIDCSDESDEKHCGPCDPIEHFPCTNGFQCLEKSQECDGVVQCSDESDENQCVCTSSQFECTTGVPKCIRDYRECNGVWDCQDGSDEIDCGVLCRSHQFTCANNTSECISKWRVCDSYKDCEDGSDELNCVCSDDEFACTVSGCVPASDRCNGDVRCSDASDEIDCGCNGTDFQCAVLPWPGAIRCVPSEWVCNGRRDCDDYSDESNCNCRDDQFTCVSGNISCVPMSDVCDSWNDCLDASDELNCECTPDQFQCAIGGCIDNQFECDGSKECSDGSDEHCCSGSGDECENRGKCIETGPNSPTTCKCPPFTYGEACQFITVSCGMQTCDWSKEMCVNTPWGPRCECPEQFIGTDCQISTGVCRRFNSLDCQCSIGWQKNDTEWSLLNKCIFDINECKEGLSNDCTEDCVNTIGGYFCQCKEEDHLTLTYENKVDMNIQIEQKGETTSGENVLLGSGETQIFSPLDGEQRILIEFDSAREIFDVGLTVKGKGIVIISSVADGSNVTENWYKHDRIFQWQNKKGKQKQGVKGWLLSSKAMLFKKKNKVDFNGGGHRTDSITIEFQNHAGDIKVQDLYVTVCNN